MTATTRPSAPSPGRRTIPLVLLLCAVSCGQDPPPRPDAETPVAATPEFQSSPGAQAVSFLGDTLVSPVLPPDVRAVYEARYAEAEGALETTPENVDSLIWMGRRTAYLGDFRDAIDLYTHALSLHPDDPRLYRHRGHRWLTVRDVGRAVADLERAAELVQGRPDQVEPDGLPNAMGIPTSTLHFNIFYHLALAHYVAGRFEEAARVYERSAQVSEHPDSRVATAYWRYLTLRRLGRDDEAATVLAGIDGDMDIIESTAYLDLLLLFQGQGDPQEMLSPAEEADLQSTTTAYGVGMWYLLNREPQAARRIFQRIVDAGNQWPAFGYLAAEAELAGLGRR